MTFYALTAIITFMSSLVLGIFVYVWDRRNSVNRIFALLSLSIAVFTLGQFMREIAPTKAFALFWGGNILFSGLILVPVFFLHFVFTLTNRKRILKPLIIFYVISGFFFILLHTTDWLILRDMIPKQSFNYYSIPGKLFPSFFILFLVIIVYSHFELFVTLKQSFGIKRNQIKYVTLASMIAFIGGSTSFFVDFNLNVYPIGNCFIWTYPIILAYAIVKHRLMDISFVIKKGVTYAYASFLLLIPLFLLVLYVQKSTFGHISFPFSVAILCIIFIASYFFPQVKVKAERTIEQYIFKNKFDYKKTISDLSKAMVSILNINELCRKIITTTTEAMQVKTATIFILHARRMRAINSMNPSASMRIRW